MKEVLPQMGKKVILDQDASQVLPLLQLQADGKGGLSNEGTTIFNTNNFSLMGSLCVLMLLKKRTKSY